MSGYKDRRQLRWYDIPCPVCGAEETLRSTDWIALDDFERRKIYRYLGDERVEEILRELSDAPKQPEPDSGTVEQTSFWGGEK